jgi:hypothetical protein
VLLVAIIAVAAVVAAVILMNNPNQSGISDLPGTVTSPTPSGSQPTSNPTSSGQTPTNPLAGAQSLSFKVLYTSDTAESWGYTWSAKNLGTDNMMMRIDGTFTSADTEQMTYIINGAQQKAWMNVGGQWMDLTDGFADIWSSWNDTWEGYYTDFADWSGTGEYAYSAGGNSVRFYDVQVNPILDDSLFVHVG